MTLFFPLVGVLLTGLGWVLFRNLRDTSVLLAVALGTIVLTMGLLAAGGHALTRANDNTGSQCC